MLPRVQQLTLIAALSAAYFLAGKLGLSFAAIHGSASAVWPPTGIALGALLIFGLRLWPAVFIGAFLVNVTTPVSALPALAIASGNTLEAVVGTALVTRLASGARCLDRPRDIFVFALLCTPLACAISATIGVASLALGGHAAWRDAGPIWFTWWLGDVCGGLIVAPLILLWHRTPRLGWAAGRQAEAAAMALGMAAIGLLLFAAPVLRSYPLAFLCLPPLAWAAFRFGPREVASAVALLTLIATYATERGLGPFVMNTRNESLLVLQSFMATLALMTLPIAALVAQHREAVAQREQQRAVAEDANRAKDEFLAMLSHELRNPLQAIANSGAVLRQMLGDNGAATRPLDVIARQTRHLTRLVNDLLDVTGVVAGKAHLERQAVDLEGLVRHCAQQFEEPARLGGHALAVATQPAWVQADPVRLEQVVSNLMTNALKYTPPGGRIDLSLQRDGNEAVLAVRDNGIGIAPDLLPRVFDLFTQGDRTLERSEGGLGVGLTLVQRLVRLHGGDVTATSDGPGRGSRLEVRLPCMEAPPEAASTAAPAPGTQKHRVLIVEDNADARESLRVLLEIEGHEAYEAEDGETGIELARRLRPDVVLIDIGLPRIDGYAMARSLRAGGDGAMRLVALTGYGRPEDRQRSREAGFDAHLVKPVDIAQLHELLAAEPP